MVYATSFAARNNKMGSCQSRVGNYLVPFFPRSTSPPRGDLLLDLLVELLFQLLFEGTSQQSALDSQTGQPTRGQAGNKGNDKLIHFVILSLDF